MRRFAAGVCGAFLGLTLIVAGIAGVNRVAAQSGEDLSPADHPVVGAWTLVTDEGDVSVIALTSDGVVLDTEQDGGSGIGTWQAQDEMTAAFTLIILVSEEDMSLSITVRGTITVDAATDTASLKYSLTAFGDGTLFFAGDGAGTATRIPVEGPELAGSPVAGFPVMAATPEP
jgi:hypothetical protein